MDKNIVRSMGNRLVSRGIWDKYCECYLGSFEISQAHKSIYSTMLFFVETTRNILLSLKFLFVMYYLAEITLVLTKHISEISSHSL